MPTVAISRRAFLKSALGLTAGGLATTLPLAGCQPAGYSSPDKALTFLTAKEYRVLDAAAARLIPAGPNRPGGRESGVADLADALFARANPRLQADIKKLLNSFEDMTYLALRFRPFTTMSPTEQDAYLQAWMTGPFALQRQAFVGLNRIASMLHYMDERAWPAIGYGGPWIGRFDVGWGLDNQKDMKAPTNPHVFARYPA